MNDETKITVSFKNNVGGEAKLEKYRKTLLDINSVLSGLNTGAAKQIEQAAANTKSISKNVSKMAQQGSVAFNYTTVRTYARAIKNLSTTIGNYVSKSAAYLENMNLLDVAYNNNTTSATKFVNKLSEMYGLDESWGYRTVGIFKQLSNAMGIAAEKGNQVSETLTQFAIDVSSLYNIETADAVQIISSALAGQTKPARRLGADITMSTLQTTLDQAGIDKEIANLSYAEKRLVIIASLLGQVSEANNDWGRTIESVANQTRIMHEQWNRLTRTFGNMLLPLVKKILPYVNGILMALTEIFSVIATLLGYDEADFDFFGTADVDLGDYLDDLGDLDEKNKKATTSTEKLKKAQMGLRSFDKLNNITTPSTGGAGSGGGGGISGGAGSIGADIWSLAKKAMDDYESKLTDVKMRATEIRDQIMDWLGFTKIIDEETGKVSFKFDHITSGTVLGALAVGGAIFGGIVKIVGMLKTIGLLKFPILSSLLSTLGAKTGLTKGFQLLFTEGTKFGPVLHNFIVPALSKLGSILGPVAVIVAALVAEYQALKREKVQEQIARIANKIKELGEKLEPLKPFLLGIKPILEAILPSLEAIAGVWEIIVDAFETNARFVLSGIEAIIDGFTTFVNIITALKDKDIKGVFDAIGDGFKKIHDDLNSWLDNDEGNSSGSKKSILGGFTESVGEATNAVHNAVLQEQADIEALTEMLGGLIDKNGKVNDSNKAKAKIIADELSKATGQQIKLDKDQITVNGKVVKSQKDLAKQMDILIAKQKLMILLEADKDKYVEALKRQKKMQDEVDEAERKYNESLLNNSEQGKINQQRYYEMWQEALRQQGENTRTVENYEALMAGQYKTSSKDIENITNDYINGTAITTEQAAKNAATAATAGIDAIMGNITSKTKKEVDNMKKEISAKKFVVTINAIIKAQTVSSNLNKVASDIANLFKADGGILINGKWQPVTNYASGGLPPVGQMFVAREKGPELVGTINGSTAVMNNNQIVSSVASGVYQAVRSAMGNSNSNQVYNIYLDKNNKLATYTLEQLQEMATTNGKPIRIGG